MWKSERVRLMRWAVMLIVLLLGGVAMQVVTMPRRLMACTPPPPPFERFTLTFDTVMSDGPTDPDIAAYQGVQVSLEAFGDDALTLVALDAAQRTVQEIYHRVR